MYLPPEIRGGGGGKMYHKISLKDAEKVYIKTFGGFDLYYKGKEIDFSNARAKELLAVLVDQEGRDVGLREMACILSDGEEDEAAKRAVHVAWSRLRKTLSSYGLSDIVRKRRGFYALNRSRIQCDCWEMLEEGEDRYFMGEYMPEYSWAEVTLSYLLRKFEERETGKIEEAQTGQKNG